MIKEEALQQVGSGWSDLIDKYYSWLAMIGWEATEVTTVDNRRGMLYIKAESHNVHMQEMLDKLSWAIERDSALVCEQCGQRGYRRKALEGSPNRCKECYIILMNELAESEEE